MSFTFLALGHARHPQISCLVHISLSLPALFFFFLFPHIVVATSCGDGICNRGHDTAIFYMGTGQEAATLFLNESITMQAGIGEKKYSVTLLSVDKQTLRAGIRVAGLDDYHLLENEFKMTDGIKVMLVDILLSQGDESISCPSDCDECASAASCSDGDACTLDNCTGIPKVCENLQIEGCDISSFHDVGSVFFIGSGKCAHRAEFVSADSNNNTIVLDTDVYGLVHLQYPNVTGNYYGVPLSISFTDYGANITYPLRYSPQKHTLYTEDSAASCPESDTCLLNEDCIDNNSCTLDYCTGDPQKCINKPILYCKTGDGCCPEQCSEDSDKDCALMIKPSPAEGSVHDINGSVGLSGQDDVTQLNMTVPGACSQNNCTSAIGCGDGACSDGEYAANCCIDCGCSPGYSCDNNTCNLAPANAAREKVESSEIFIGADSKLVGGGYSAFDSEYLMTNSGYTFEYNYRKGDSSKKISGTISSGGDIIILDGGTGKLVFYSLVTLGIIILSSVILIIMSAKKIPPDMPKGKEAYYQQLSKRPQPSKVPAAQPQPAPEQNPSNIASFQPNDASYQQQAMNMANTQHYQTPYPARGPMQKAPNNHFGIRPGSDQYHQNVSHQQNFGSDPASRSQQLLGDKMLAYQQQQYAYYAWVNRWQDWQRKRIDAERKEYEKQKEAYQKRNAR